MKNRIVECVLNHFIENAGLFCGQVNFLFVSGSIKSGTINVDLLIVGR
jgi:hypothetical protein